MPGARACLKGDIGADAALYGKGDSEKRALAGDVAALANTGGGAVLGVEKDDQARATKAPGLEISDAEVAMIRRRHLNPVATSAGVHRTPPAPAGTERVRRSATTVRAAR